MGVHASVFDPNKAKKAFRRSLDTPLYDAGICAETSKTNRADQGADDCS